jgi:hypothetical protein
VSLYSIHTGELRGLGLMRETFKRLSKKSKIDELKMGMDTD